MTATAHFFPVVTCTRCTKRFVVGSERHSPTCAACSTQLELAQERLRKAAVAIGSMLLDGVDPAWNDAVEFEQAAVDYAKAIRTVKS